MRSFIIAAALAVLASPASPQTIDPADFTTNATGSGGAYTNYNPNGTLSTGLTLNHISFDFLVPVYNLTFSYNQFGHSYSIQFNGANLPVGATSPEHPSSWFDVSMPSSLPSLYSLQFHYPYLNSGFGVRLTGYSKPDSFAAPAPNAGAGLVALALLWLLYAAWGRKEA